MILSAPDFPPEVLQPEDIELKRIYLLSRFHGGGTARRMMNLALETSRELGAKRVLLGVHRDNARALAFYGRNGFTPVGTRLFRLGNSVYDDPVLALTL
jgi:ribosomal protein S18 acetylase RimI-like enzyme